MSKLENAVISLAQKDPQKASFDMSVACNTFGLDIKGFLELMRESPQSEKVWRKICWYWIASLSQRFQRGEFDRRNEQACYYGYQIQQAVNETYKPLPEIDRDAFIPVFIRKMAHDHRTLQQSFSSLVFAWLHESAMDKNDKKARCAIKNITGNFSRDRWYVMPMI